IWIISLLIIIPSGFTFWNTIQESIFENNAERFVTENFEFDGTEVINKKITFEKDSMSLIEVYLIGEIIPTSTEQRIQTKLREYDLTTTKLKIHQSKDKTEEIAGQLSAKIKSGILEDIYEKNESMLNSKEAKIDFLQDELLKYKGDTIPFAAIKNEMAVQYPDVINMSYAKAISTNFNDKQDTIKTFFMTWKPSINDKEIVKQKTAMENWLRVRLNDSKVRVFNY
ncbi:MAG: hypothetical protein P8Q14_10760, partial [Vicingaceae bacterium]|nr:hypothetical protein [Vicingaceae bacterium]